RLPLTPGPHRASLAPLALPLPGARLLRRRCRPRRRGRRVRAPPRPPRAGVRPQSHRPGLPVPTHGGRAERGDQGGGTCPRPQGPPWEAAVARAQHRSVELGTITLRRGGVGGGRGTLAPRVRLHLAREFPLAPPVVPGRGLLPRLLVRALGGGKAP